MSIPLQAGARKVQQQLGVLGAPLRATTQVYLATPDISASDASARLGVSERHLGLLRATAAFQLVTHCNDPDVYVWCDKILNRQTAGDEALEDRT